MKTDHELDQLTSNWAKLGKNIKTLTEEEVKRALTRRLATPTSKDIAVRLHQRYCALRDARERQEILAVFAPVEPIPDFLGGANA